MDNLFTTPGGHPVRLAVRDGTADWNTAQSSLTEDEYGLKGMKLDGVALDIGGYIGSVTAGLLLDHPDLHVITVEPIPENIELIRANVPSKAYDRWTLVTGAAGYHGGTTTIHYDYGGDDGRVDDFANQHRWVGNAHGHALYSAGETHQSVEVDTYSIADLVPEGDIALAKLDCEGGEWDFLDDPDVARVAFIVGEFHPLTADPTEAILDRLSATHVVTFTGPSEGPGNFRAVRK